MPLAQRARELIKQGDKLFADRAGLLALWDELALNFYPERADFLGGHTLGQEFANHLMESFPVRARAELASALPAMLRPRGRQWFAQSTGDDELDSKPDNARFLEARSERMRREMYRHQAQFVRATREGDNDYVTFGNAVLSVEEAPTRDHLLYRNWHMRDCAWMENELGVVDVMHRNLELTARAALRRWGAERLHRDIVRAAKKEPAKKFKFRNIVLPMEEYRGTDKKGPGIAQMPFANVYVDLTNQALVSEGGLPAFTYIVPRWQTVSGSVYAFSPAAVIALPDARFAQDMARILIEQGEKAVDPPALAMSEVIRSDVDLFAGGITWVDSEYDERLGDPLRFLESRGNFNLGLEFRQDNRETVAASFFLNKLQLPGQGDMTAFEVNERVKEFVRGALPLFEPMETDYNLQILEKTHAVLENAAAFDNSDIPDDLKGLETTFTFESPLQDAAKRIEIAQFSETLQLLGQSAQARGEQAIPPVDLDKALKDAIRGTGAPASWLLDEEQLEAAAEEAAQAQALREAAASLSEGAGVASDVAQAAGDLADAGLTP